MTITREQLEKAAKAAGIEIYLQRFYAADGPTAYLGGIKWEPYIDHGQLLDLAMACKIGIEPRTNYISYYIEGKTKLQHVNCQDFPALAEAVILAACEQFDAANPAQKKEYTMGDWFNDLDHPHQNR